MYVFQLFSHLSHALMFLFLGMLLSYMTWNTEVEFVSFSLILFFVYLVENKRSTIGFLVFGYYLYSARALIQSISYYYHSDLKAYAIWLLYAFVGTAVWIFVWSHSFKKRVMLFFILLLILTLPPIGLLTSHNPLSAAGIFFPGEGYMGLLYLLLSTVLLSFSLYHVKYKRVRWVMVVTLMLIVVPKLELKVEENHAFYPLKTKFLYTPDDMNLERKKVLSKKLLEKIKTIEHEYILGYENMFGTYKEDDMPLWRTLSEGKILFGGAHLYYEGKDLYDNVVLKMEEGKCETVYKQRIPMPISMWKPFSNEGAKLHLFENAVVENGGKKLGFFICYEQILVFPYLQTMYYEPEVLLGLSNLWWDRGDSFLGGQRKMMQLWASLMGVPFYFSYNR